MIVVGFITMMGVPIAAYPLSSIIARTDLVEIEAIGLPIWATSTLFIGGFFVLVGVGCIIFDSKKR